MSCTKPALMEVISLYPHQQNLVYFDRLKRQGWKVGKDNSKAYRFISYKSRSMPLEIIDKWQTQDIIEIPCGSCLSCRIDYAEDWAVRCEFESKLWKNNIFLTLNYDDEHVPRGKYGNMSLSSDDVDRFINSLRRKFHRLGHKGVRYMLCGEYNSSGERALNPHYHMILFNCPLTDLTIDIPDGKGHIIHKINDFTKMPYLYSKFIADLWQDKDGKPKGQVIIDDANFNTSSYVSKYIMKKQKGVSSSIYTETYGVEVPFLRMSSKPGIGFNMFMKDFSSYVDDPLVIIPRLNKRPMIKGLPKYYKRKMFEKQPQLRDVFENNAKEVEKKLRSLRAHYGQTSNMQKEAQENHINSVATVFARDKA